MNLEGANRSGRFRAILLLGPTGSSKTPQGQWLELLRPNVIGFHHSAPWLASGNVIEPFALTIKSDSCLGGRKEAHQTPSS
jgi:hypothetical protein